MLISFFDVKTQSHFTLISAQIIIICFDKVQLYREPDKFCEKQTLSSLASVQCSDPVTNLSDSV